MSKKRILTVAFTYVGAIVGAGFSSGQEIWRFFGQYQEKGLYGVLCTALFFCILAPFLFYLSRKKGFSSYSDCFQLCFPGPLSTVFDLIYSMFMLGTAAVMLSGGGTVFEELLGLAYYQGVLFTLIFVLIILYMNRRGILAVNSILMPIMIAITLFSVIYYLVKSGERGYFNYYQLFLYNSSGWFKDAILYGAYNISMAIAALSGIFALEAEKNIVKGGILGGFILFILNLLFFLALIAAFPGRNYCGEIPILLIARKTGKGVYLAYTLALYFAMISTAVAVYYAFTERLIRFTGLSYNKGLFLSMIIVLPFTSFDFSTLVSKLYPLFGYFGILIITAYLWAVIKNR
ncbi:MAG TPA: hypothetical protein VKY40_01975 [Halanaerobiales bacterium]|nr:hypothetical protein [Halanaerobiales bacterium]